MTEKISDREGSVEAAKITAGSKGSQPAQGRRRLFHRLLALAGLGITGVLLSQEKTGLLPPVYANTGSYSDTTSPVLNVTNTSTSAPWTAILGTSQGIGVAGYSSGSSSSSSIAVLGQAGTATAMPIVANGASGQTADLQQWQVNGTVKSRVSYVGGLVVPYVSIDSTVSPAVAVTQGSTSAPWTAILGTSQGIGVAGYSSGSSSSSSIAVLGQAGSTTAKPIVAQGASGQTANLQEWQNSSNSALSVVDKNGQIGIGTTSPQSYLHVKAADNAFGLFEATDTANFAGFRCWNAGNDVFEFNAWGPNAPYGRQNDGELVNITPTGRIVFFTNSTRRMVLDSAGRLGIGTTSPSHLIHLNGGAYCDGTGAWIAGSSVRWKENIEPLTGAVDTLKQLHPVAYNRKETPAKRTMGFIAEEVGKVLPTVVDWDKAEPGYAEGYDHLAILALATQAIKEQQSTIQQLQEEFKNANGKLQERIAILERTVKQFAAS